MLAKSSNKSTANTIIGVDTHKSTHIAVTIDNQGERLAELSILTSPKGYNKLEAWSCSLGIVQAFGI